MEQTQRFDPNKIPDPNRTQAVPGGAQPFVDDLGRTQMVPGSEVGGRALSLQVIPGRPVAAANGPAREAYLVEVSASGATMGAGRLPLNLCLVIDRSGSMEGEPLNYVKQACGYVVDLLNPNDVLSIVTFEETVEVLMPPRRVVNKQLVKEHIQRLEPGNTTNIFDGLTLGVQQLLSVPNEGRLSRLLLLTDGEPTAGIKDFNSIVNVVATKKDNGVTCTALGFGPEYNEELIAGLARRSGGNYYYIQRPELIPEVFRKELERMMTVVGRNLRLKLDFSRWVQIRQVYNNQVPMTGRSFEIGLVDLERGSRVDTVMELEFPNHPVGTFRIAKATLTYEDSVTNRQEQVVQDVVIDFTSDTFKLNIPQDPRVAQEVEVAQASKSLERTMMGMKTQQLSAATMALELQKTQQLLVSQGRTMEAQEVAQAIRDLQRGDVGNVEKTLIGTKLTLEQGKTQKRS